jgi:hypothetical protein
VENEPPATTGAIPSRGASFPGVSWVLALLFFVAFTVLYTRNNTFHFTYHADENGKVQQVLTGSRNFNHPLLMLDAAQLAFKASGLPATRQNVVIVGRWCVAVFAAAAVAAFAAAAYHAGGLTAGVGAGLLIGLQPALFELAHFFKEDPALLMGLAFVVLALVLFRLHGGRRHIVFLGVACAVAASGKYLGAATIPIALVTLLVSPRRDGEAGRAQRLVWFLVPLVLLFCLLNLQALLNLAHLRSSLDRELVHIGAGGGKAVSREVPHLKYLSAWEESVPVMATVFLFAHLAVLVIRRPRTALVDWMLFGFGLAFAVGLSFSPKTAGRYFLPVSTLACYLAALGVADVARELGSLVKRPFAFPAAALAGIAVLAGFQLRPMWSNYVGFTKDTRKELAAWVRAHVPADAIIAQERRVSLGNQGDEMATDVIPQKIINATRAPDLGSIADIQARGVRYLIVMKANYGGYLDKRRKLQSDQRELYEKNKAFYEELFQRGGLVWESEGGSVGLLQAEVRMYQLPESASKPTAPAPDAR